MLITKNVVTKEEVVAAVKELAAKLGRSPRYPELIREVNVTRRQIQRMFGGWAGVLEESGCERIRMGGSELTMHELWHDWAAVARKTQRMPTIRQYEKFSRYSVRPLKDRFAAWDRIPTAMLEYGDSKSLWVGWEDVRELIGRQVDVCTPGERYRVADKRTSFTAENAEAEERVMNGPVRSDGQGGLGGASGLGVRRDGRGWGIGASLPSPQHGQTPRVLGTFLPEVIDPDSLYAEPLNLAPMATAPENENGVLFLFGTLARELGFVVLKVRPGFPDVLALRRLANGKWQWVRVEVERDSRNFVLHGHDVKGCDLIVCWENNWSDCPIEVLELKKLFCA